MSEEKTSYREIMKATSLFGGVQFFNIIIQIIRSKFIAVLLGPQGMGIAGLLTAAIGLISGISNFGLGTSAVKNVAVANGSGDLTRIAIIIIVLRRWVWVTGLLGMIITVITAPLLSRITFGNNEYTFSFIWISVTLLFTQLSSGQIVLLQGMRKLKSLAKSSLIGSISGLLFTVPLYYFFGIKGIVPAIIITSAITLIGTSYFARKIEINKIPVSKEVTFTEGKEMLIMGFLISISGLITLGASYILRIFISRTGGLEQVGFYNAGFAIINTYVGLVFTAMGTDYYPRLSAVSQDNKLCKKTINQQSEIAILILAPILLIFLTFINLMVIILYSKQFIPINGMIYWAALGMFFKAVCWSIGFVFLAKGSGRLFFWNELIVNIYLLGFNLLGYHFWGLTGLGISFAISYFLYFIQVFIVSKIKFEFSFDLDFIKIFIFQFVLAIIGFLSVIYLTKPFSYILGSMLIGISVLYSLIELDKRLDIRPLILKLKKHI